MVPKVAGKGTSFKGAALYYLHDKGAMTQDRVLFTLTENLPTNEPDIAIAIMAHTAINQQRIKERAGGSAKGRKLAQPVYTYSLSWAPGEAPTQDHMIATARESLQALGLQRHEALLVAHNDEPHPHIHIIVNRVDPHTGIAAKLSNDHLKLSAWAEAYEKQQGVIRCEQRVENNKRRKNEYVKDAGNDNSAAFYQWRRDRIMEDFAIRSEDAQSLSAAHRAQRQALFAAKEQQVRHAKARIRDEYRRFWQAHYQTEKSDRVRLGFEKRLAAAQLRTFLKNAGKGYFHAETQENTGHLSKHFGATVDFERKRAEMNAKHKENRARTSAKQTAAQRDAFKSINDQFKRDLAVLKERQHHEQHDLALRQAAQSQQTAQDIKTGADVARFRAAQMDKKRAAFRANAADITTARPRPARDFKQVTADRQRPARDFAAAAKDRPRPVRDFKQAAGTNASMPARDAESAREGSRDGSREGRTEKLQRELRENASDITSSSSQETGPQRNDERSPCLLYTSDAADE